MRILSSFSLREGSVGTFDNTGCFAGNFLVRTGARAGLCLFSRFEPAVPFGAAADAGGVAVNRKSGFPAFVA
jgi:hypothetical protein